MKTNTFFYTLLIALFSVSLFSCDENDELTNVEESIEFEEESNFKDVVFEADIDEDDPIESLPDSTFQAKQKQDATIFNMNYDEEEPVDLTKLNL